MKITYWNRRNGKFDSFKMFMRRLYRWSGIALVLSFLLLFAFSLGAATFSTTTVEAQMTPAEIAAPVLDRIADCESGSGVKGTATHYKNGQVLLKPNKNGTVDVGKYQINSIWFKKATELGLDITKEKDNEKFAEWLYLNKGTGDWTASVKCWQR